MRQKHINTPMYLVALLTLFISGSSILVEPGHAETLSVDQIIQKANHMALYQGFDGKGTVTLTITDKQGRTRIRKFNMLRKNDDTQNQNQKYYTFFQSPPDVRKMAFLVHKHAAPDKDDDRWLYLPSLDLVKRIAASDKRTSFVGSDFLYEDISGRSPGDDYHKLLETTEKFYVLKNTPRYPDNVEFTSYIAHIDKTTFIPMKIEFYKADSRLYRVIESLEVRKISALENGQPVVYPTVVRSVAKDLENGSSTEMTFTNIEYNIGLDDALFTERYLRRPPRIALR